MTTTKTAVAYYRTSSATNVGGDRDSLKRQKDAVHAYATSQALEIVKEYYDPAVSGADAVMDRPGFSEMLQYLLSNGARTVLVENASRFARDLVVQITGHDLLKARGISLVPVDAPNHFEDETPTAVMVRQILGAVSQFEKNSLVLKLKKARERKRRETGKCEGNPDFGNLPMAHIEAARKAQRKGLSLRGVSAHLASQGILSASGKPYVAASVNRMLKKQQL
jgi:DNA invertase Pin-like site-specific DNA recombinase